MIEGYKRDRLEKVKGPTVNRELACLKHMYTLAIKWGMAPENPVKGVEFLPENKHSMRVLSDEEAAQLIGAASPHFRPVLLTALNTGMRLGEILNLRWEDVNLREGFISVEQSKSGEPRKIPTNSVLTDVLRDVRMDRGDPYVFLGRWGKKVHSFRKVFETALKRAGIGKCRFHDLRHTFASNLVMSGVDIVTVKELLGHKTIQMTMRHSHPSPNTRRLRSKCW